MYQTLPARPNQHLKAQQCGSYLYRSVKNLRFHIVPIALFSSTDTVSAQKNLYSCVKIATMLYYFDHIYLHFLKFQSVLLFILKKLSYVAIRNSATNCPFIAFTHIHGELWMRLGFLQVNCSNSYHGSLDCSRHPFTLCLLRTLKNHIGLKVVALHAIKTGHTVAFESAQPVITNVRNPFERLVAE